MSPELEEKLLKKYPKIFPISGGNSNDEVKRSSLIASYGIDCGDGWYTIIDTLCGSMQSHIDAKIEGLDKEDTEHYQVVAEQVKEKYGTLRFYHYNGDEYISGMIRMAESMSSKICEDCGSKSEVVTKGWIRNLCMNCNNKSKVYKKENV